MKKLVQIFWFFWGLPQNLIGLFLFLLYYKKETFSFKDSFVTKIDDPKGGGAVSLGLFIFTFFKYSESYLTRIVRHEYGHSIQSKILGPFYLIVIGIPSFVWANFFEWYRVKYKVDYYSFYTEKWADRLGGL